MSSTFSKRMGTDVVFTQWPIIVWKIKDLQKLKQAVKKKVILNGNSFDLILEQMHSDSNKASFKMCIEGVQQLPSKDQTDNAMRFNVKVNAYILGKLDDKCSSKGIDKCLNDKEPIEIWSMDHETFQRVRNEHKQSEVEVCLACIFEPVVFPGDISPEALLLSQECHEANREILPWKSLEKLSSDFESFFERSKGDYTVKCGNVERWVHGDVLSVRCPNLWKKFINNEPGFTEFEISDLSPKILEIFLMYVYCGKIPDIGIKEAQELFMFSARLSMENLMTLCAETIEHRASEEEILGVLLNAHEQKQNDLKDRITDLLLRKNMLRTQLWLSFSENHKELALDVYHANVKKHSD